MDIFNKLKNKLVKLCFIRLRVLKYKLYYTCKNIKGKPIVNQPIVCKGKGKIIFGEGVVFGFEESKNFYTHYGYIEARTCESKIVIGDRVLINNSISLEANQSITIGDDVLIGVNCSIFDSDGHSLDIEKRKTGIPNTKGVIIEKNVFIGDDVTILKGVKIGKNAIIGCRSVVTSDVSENCIYAGNPARLIRKL